MDLTNKQPVDLDTRPLFERAMESLLTLIEGPGYQPGDQLPSEGVLAQQLGVSRSTLREAIRYLESRGMIVRRRGIGTFVAGLATGQLQGGLEQLESVRSLAAKQGIALERLEWKVSLVPASPILADTLGKNPGDTLIRCETIAALDGQVFSYMDGHIPNRLADVDELRTFERGSLLDYLVEEGDLQLSFTRTEVFAIEAGARISSRLGVEQGSALLRLRETYFVDSGQPVVHYENYFLTKILNFHIYRRVLRGRSKKS